LRIHHANASLLAEILSKIPCSASTIKTDQDLITKSKILYPQVLQFPVFSEFLLDSLPRPTTATEPITPITPTSGGVGGGGEDGPVETETNALKPTRRSSRSANRSISQPLITSDLATRHFDDHNEDVSSKGVVEEEKSQGSVSKKRKLEDEGGTDSGNEEKPNIPLISPTTLR
jgi:hypothetical protein